jgi:hypothetical protein
MSSWRKDDDDDDDGGGVGGVGATSKKTGSHKYKT